MRQNSTALRNKTTNSKSRFCVSCSRKHSAPLQSANLQLLGQISPKPRKVTLSKQWSHSDHLFKLIISVHNFRNPFWLAHTIFMSSAHLCHCDHLFTLCRYNFSQPKVPHFVTAK